MNIQTYLKDNFSEMESMHDSIVTKISISDKTLTVTYNNLNIDYYKSKRLTVEYEINSFCDVCLFKKNRYKFIDLLEESNKFNKLTNNCTFMSYKYAVDSFNEITLFFDIREKNKYWNFEISMDAEKIIYHWE